MCSEISQLRAKPSVPVSCAHRSVQYWLQKEVACRHSGKVRNRAYKKSIVDHRTGSVQLQQPPLIRHTLQARDI